MSRSRTICLKLRDSLAKPTVKHNNDKWSCQIIHAHCGPTGREQRNVPPRPHLPQCHSSKGNDRWPKAVISCKTTEYQIQMKGKFWFWCRHCVGHTPVTSVEKNACLLKNISATCFGPYQVIKPAVRFYTRVRFKKKRLFRYVRPSVLTYQCGFHWTDLYEIWYWGIVCKSVEKIQI
jgi:hypothetical protein